MIVRFNSCQSFVVVTLKKILDYRCLAICNSSQLMKQEKIWKQRQLPSESGFCFTHTQRLRCFMLSSGKRINTKKKKKQSSNNAGMLKIVFRVIWIIDTYSTAQSICSLFSQTLRLHHRIN